MIMPKVIIIGAGIVGSLNACFFAERGWEVEVYEFRPDIRKLEHLQGRSINLALSFRGKAALECVGLKEYIIKQGIPMYARLVHNPDGVTFNRQPYGHPEQHIVSINRRHLNEVLITQAEKVAGVNFYFEHKLRDVKFASGKVAIQSLTDNQMIEAKSDLICGCDGAYSTLRKCFMSFSRFDFQQRYIGHGYVELNILPQNGQFACDPNVFHLWPRENFCLIALANIDMSFTVTLFAPFEIFQRELDNDDKVVQFFNRHFPDALKLIGSSEVIKTFRRVSPGSLISIKCNPHDFSEKFILLGDAAHAMVPFYGQGMNSGFEDCLLLKEFLDCTHDDIGRALKLYSENRCIDAAAICDLAMYNYLELRHLVNKPGYKIRKKFDLLMNHYFPIFWMPLYGMVTFSRIRYHKAVIDRKCQDKLIKNTISCFAFIGLGAISLLFAWKWKKINFLPRIQMQFQCHWQ